MPRDGRTLAVRVRRGDTVTVRGRSLEVSRVRMDRNTSGGPIIVILFKGAPALYVRPGDRIEVQRKRAR